MKEAAAAHLAVSAKHGSNPIARVLGHAYAARAYEGQGQFDVALREYQQALDGWDDDYGPTYSVYLMRSARPADPLWASDGAQVLKQALPGRIGQLTHSLAQPGGTLLERGRWLLEQEQRQDAIATLQELLTDRRPAPVEAEARYLMHRAQLEMALDLADEDRAPDEASAMQRLVSLGGEPLDAAVTVAKIARACLLCEEGSAGRRALDDAGARAMARAAAHEETRQRSGTGRGGHS
jgi:tetratricopeptide (TPR) repeat protein